MTLDPPWINESELIPGQSMTVNVSVNNEGDDVSDSTTLNYLLSSDDLISLTDSRMGSDGAPSLSAESSSTQQLVLKAASTSGYCYIGVCADPVADELSVANNCSQSTRIRVISKPECTNRSLSCGGSQSETALAADDCTDSPRGDGFLAESLNVNTTAGTSLIIDAGFSNLDGYLILQAPSGAVVAETTM